MDTARGDDHAISVSSQRNHPAAGALAALAAFLLSVTGFWVDAAVSADTTPQRAASAEEIAPSAVATTGVRPLRVLAAHATVIALASITRTESYDDDRLRLYRLHVERTIRGRLDAPEPGVVEIRGGTMRPGVLSDGERAILLLEPAPSMSYLAEHLAGQPTWSLAGGRDGVLLVANEAEVDAVEHVLAEGVRIAGLGDAEARVATRRLAFTELGGPSPRLAADAVVELRRLQDLVPLATDERDALARALRDRRIDPVTRISLIALLGERRAVEAIPALTAAAAGTPAVLDALMTARARLGAPAGRSELAPLLASKDPATRAAAIHALARLDDPAALAEVGRYATTDTDRTTRLAAVEALGESNRPAAIPYLVRTFAEPERELMQKSARALLAIDDPKVDDALVDLATREGSPQTQTYAALILVVSRGRDSPAVRRLEASNPPPAVRKLLDHGLEFLDKHGAE
jgi:HEAT repeat protein